MSELMPPLIVAGCLLASAACGQTFDGLYRPAGPSGENWSCDERFIGQDGGALAILDGYLEGLENRCELLNPQAVDIGVSYVAICNAEGSQYRDQFTIRRTRSGISLQGDGETIYWTSCDLGSEGGEQAPERPVSPSERWTYQDRHASIISAGSAFSLSCEPFNASASYPTATFSGPCPLCWPGETAEYELTIDGDFSQTFTFERVSNAVGSVSTLDYYPDWYGGVVAALMAGSRLDVFEGEALIASFPLNGSSRAISALRDWCN